MPDVRFSRANGFELAVPYYLKLAPNRDLTLTPHFYSDVRPHSKCNIGRSPASAPTRSAAMVTESRRKAMPATRHGSERGIRGYIDASGRFQLDPKWSISSSIRVATDRTFLRRYDISRDDRLRSTIRVERIGAESYLSMTGWATQTLRINDRQGQQPIALPEIDYRRRLEGVPGGRVEVQLNSSRSGGRTARIPSARSPARAGICGA